MKKIKYLILITNILFCNNLLKAEIDLSLQSYLDKNDIEKGETQIYLFLNIPIFFFLINRHKLLK